MRIDGRQGDGADHGDRHFYLMISFFVYRWRFRVKLVDIPSATGVSTGSDVPAIVGVPFCSSCFCAADVFLVVLAVLSLESLI